MPQTLSDIRRAAELKWRGAAPGLSREMANSFMAALQAGKTVRMLTCGERNTQIRLSSVMADSKNTAN
jgi:hypothetical protein